MIDIGSSYRAGITRSAHFKMKTQNNADGMALWKVIFLGRGIFVFAALKGIDVCIAVGGTTLGAGFMLSVCYTLRLSLHLASPHRSFWHRKKYSSAVIALQ